MNRCFDIINTNKTILRLHNLKLIKKCVIINLLRVIISVFKKLGGNIYE